MHHDHIPPAIAVPTAHDVFDEMNRQIAHRAAAVEANGGSVEWPARILVDRAGAVCGAVVMIRPPAVAEHITVDPPNA